MTKESLQAKILLYQREFDQAKANANALQGAIQALQQLILELDSETKKEEAV